MESSRYSTIVGFVDLLFLTLTGFVFLFVVAFIMMNPPDPSKIDPKVEAIMVLSWPIEAEHDFDLWMKLPNGTHVGYQITEHRLGHLDRDDRGNADDEITLPDGRIIKNPINREVISLRGLEPGTYIINVHFYGAFTTQYTSEENGPGSPSGSTWPRSFLGSVPTEITVEFVDLQPAYKHLYSSRFVLAIVQSERTAFQFTITPDGDIVDINETQVPFVVNDLFVSDSH